MFSPRWRKVFRDLFSYKMRTFLVVNPESAGGATGRRWPEIRAEVLRALGDGAEHADQRTDQDPGHFEKGPVAYGCPFQILCQIGKRSGICRGDCLHCLPGRHRKGP